MDFYIFDNKDVIYYELKYIYYNNQDTPPTEAAPLNESNPFIFSGGKFRRTRRKQRKRRNQSKRRKHSKRRK